MVHRGSTSPQGRSQFGLCSSRPLVGIRLVVPQLREENMARVWPRCFDFDTFSTNSEFCEHSLTHHNTSCWYYPASSSAPLWSESVPVSSGHYEIGALLWSLFLFCFANSWVICAQSSLLVSCTIWMHLLGACMNTFKCWVDSTGPRQTGKNPHIHTCFSCTTTSTNYLCNGCVYLTLSALHR